MMTSFRFSLQNFLLVAAAAIAIASVPKVAAESYIRGYNDEQSPFFDTEATEYRIRTPSPTAGPTSNPTVSPTASSDPERCTRKTSAVNIISSTASTSEELAPSFEYFRGILGGDLNGNTPESKADGHRQINWDADVVPFEMPGDFFASNVTRGAIISTSSGEFRVSDESSIPDIKFDSIVGLELSNRFQPFSNFRLFSTLDDNTLSVTFVNPGNVTQEALVSGFGAVFVDVDLPDTTKMEYFDVSGCVLAEVFVRPQPGGLSFLGVDFGDAEPIVARVKITLGNTSLKDAENADQEVDVVVMDDFLYGEPQVLDAVPSWR